MAYGPCPCRPLSPFGQHHTLKGFLTLERLLLTLPTPQTFFTFPCSPVTAMANVIQEPSVFKNLNGWRWEKLTFEKVLKKNNVFDGGLILTSVQTVPLFYYKKKIFWIGLLVALKGRFYPDIEETQRTGLSMTSLNSQEQGYPWACRYTYLIRPILYTGFWLHSSSQDVNPRRGRSNWTLT